MTDSTAKRKEQREKPLLEEREGAPLLEEDAHTALSWTSGSLSPDNPTFEKGSSSNTDNNNDEPTTTNSNSLLRRSKVSLTGLQTLETTTTIHESSLPTGLPPSTTTVLPPQTIAQQQLQHPLDTSTSAPRPSETAPTLLSMDATDCFRFPEDDHGEPVVDESLLSILSSQSNSYHHHVSSNNEQDHHHYPLMLETSSHDDEDLDASGFLPSLPSVSFEALSIISSLSNNNNSNALSHSVSCPQLTQQPPQPTPSTDVALPVKLSSSCQELNELNPSNSLLHQFHKRHPSTIVEEFSESMGGGMVSEDGDRPALHEQLSVLSEGSAGLSPPTSPSRSKMVGQHTEETAPLLSRVPSVTNATNTTTTRPFGFTGDPLAFLPLYSTTKCIQVVSKVFLPQQHGKHAGAATWIGFWALLVITCANYVLTPMRDAIALQVGVEHMPKLTLASTVLALFSSVPIGWLFEAPDPKRRKVWKRMGLTRGETQGSSLALFYRFFAFVVISYAIGFSILEFLVKERATELVLFGVLNVSKVFSSLGQFMYVAFFLVVHLMKLHCLSLVWGVTTEALEYEEVARKQHQKTQKSIQMESNKMRLKRLSLVGFGGTLGGILGSFLASFLAQFLKLPGLLLLAACLLELSAELSVELGRIMQKHWEEQQQLFQSTNDLASLDPSMVRSSSLGSMKRISSGNSLNRVKSTSDLGQRSSSSGSTGNLSDKSEVSEDTFYQRMRRGVTTILQSRLLMAIFTYNALYASTTVLLSFQRAVLVANRSATTSVQADTAFLANINMASSAAIFALQASGTGAYVAHKFGSRGTLALMPLVRLLGVIALAWWHRVSGGSPPNLLVFLVVDECCKIMNLAVAKPVRESLWRGLSNEARYEAKPIVDTLANRWGGGSAAFLVSFVDKSLDLMGVTAEADGVRNMFGYPPILCLCLFISGWWAVVSADLGQIRKSIDLELKKRQ